MFDHLESRLLLSVTATTLAGPLVTGTVFTYQILNQADSADGTATTTIVGPTTFNGQAAIEIDVAANPADGPATSQQNFYAADLTGGFLLLGQTVSGVTTTFNPDEIVYPANMVASIAYGSTITTTSNAGTGTATGSSILLSELLQSITTPLATYSAYQINVNETTTLAGTSTTTFYKYYVAADVGTVEYTSTVTTGTTSVAYTYVLSSITQAVTAGPPTQVVFTTQPAGGKANGKLKSIIVQVEDADGNLVTTDTSGVTLSIASGNTDGTTALGGTLTVNAIGGIATFSNITFSQEGRFTLQATDGALDPAISGGFTIAGVAQGNTVKYPIPLVTVNTTLTKATLTDTVITGTALNDSLTLSLAQESGYTEKGAATITIYATTDGTLDSSAIAIGSTTKNVSIKSGGATSVKVSLKELPGMLEGDYTFLAVITDANGVALSTATGPTITAVPPVLTLDPTVTSIIGLSTDTPAVSDEKTKASVKVTIANSGNVASTGKSTLTLYASTDGTAADGTLIRSEALTVALKVGKNHTYTIPAKALPELADGDYFLVIVVTDANGDITTATSSTAYPIEAADVSLVPTTNSLTSHSNGTATFSYTITNEGNTPSSGTTTATLLVSADGNPADATTLASATFTKSIIATRSASFTLKLTADKTAAYNNADWIALEITDASGNVQTLLIRSLV